MHLQKTKDEIERETDWTPTDHYRTIAFRFERINKTESVVCIRTKFIRLCNIYFLVTIAKYEHVLVVSKAIKIIDAS